MTKHTDYLNTLGLVGLVFVGVCLGFFCLWLVLLVGCVFCVCVFFNTQTLCVFAQRECLFCLVFDSTSAASQPGLREPFTWKSRKPLKQLLGVKLGIQTPPLTLHLVLHNSSPCYMVVIVVSFGCSHLFERERGVEQALELER